MSCSYTFDPGEHGSSTLSEPWSCPHSRHDDSDHCIFHMEPASRSTHGVTDEDVTTAAAEILEKETEVRKEFIGAHIPALELDYIDVEAENQHPIDLRHSTIPDGVSVFQGRFEEQLDLRDGHVGVFCAENCDFENGVLCARTHFTGSVTFFEAIINGNKTDFTNATFDQDVTIDEVEFNDEVSFEQTAFYGKATFNRTQFYGRANSIDDNTTFGGATFHDKVLFRHATFKHTSFNGVTFNGDAIFEKATADGTVLFSEVTFEGVADFDEVTFGDDVAFQGSTFEQDGSFKGVEFRGGAAVLDDDISFADVVFNGDVTFEHGLFGFANFRRVQFNGDAMFERSRFTDDCSFEDTTFEGAVDFDEVLFEGDAEFSATVFVSDAVFRGAEFKGGTNHLDDNVIFEDAAFVGDADFQGVVFSSANFLDTKFEGYVDFTDATFNEELHLKAVSLGDDTYLNFTDATISEGRITQPSDGWVRIDMTHATIGDVELSAEDPTDERELLDYYRFCDTTFDEFDFSAHTAYLNRNDWKLHTFDDGTRDYEFTVEMTPSITEKTYLNAKQNASDQSNTKAAGEFRVKRQQNAREKFFNIARDRNESIITRTQNALRGIENWFLGVSCGYGLRLYRVTVVFILFPMIAAGIFALGGPMFETGAGQIAFSELFTTEGLNTLTLNIYFSYITFLTVGYGNLAPIGLGARFMAGSLVYMNVILAGLFLYALIKRSEV